LNLTEKVFRSDVFSLNLTRKVSESDVFYLTTKVWWSGVFLQGLPKFGNPLYFYDN
jgi:hypothetical protein